MPPRKSKNGGGGAGSGDDEKVEVETAIVDIPGIIPAVAPASITSGGSGGSITHPASDSTYYLRHPKCLSFR